MSILIKDMEMPKNSRVCPFAVMGGDWELVCIAGGRYEWKSDGVCEDCPLVEVPTPHGRLIDIETLKDDMAVLLERNGKLIDEWLAYRVEDTIDDQATIIEAEKGEEA